MTVYRVMIEVPDAVPDDGAVRALGELEIDRAQPEDGFTGTGVTYNDGWALVTAQVEARTPTTAASKAFAILAGAVPTWNLGEAVIWAGPSNRADSRTSARRDPHP